MPRPTRRVRRKPGDVLAVEDDLPARRLDPPADQADEGRLARPVRADDGADLARREVEIDIVDRLQPAEGAATARAWRAASRQPWQPFFAQRPDDALREEQDEEDEQRRRPPADRRRCIRWRCRSGGTSASVPTNGPGDRSRPADQRPQQRKDRILDRGEGRADIGEEQRVGGAGRCRERAGKRPARRACSGSCRSRA